MSTLCRTVMVAAGLAAATAPAAQAAVPATPSVAVDGAVESLAMSGSTVAIGGLGIGQVGPAHHGCTAVTAWNVRSGAVAVLAGSGTCLGGQTVPAIAIAGGRVAWVVSESGNAEAADRLFTSALADRVEQEPARAGRDGQATDTVELEGSWLGGPVAAAGRLVYSAWTTEFVNPDQCGLGNEDPTRPCIVHEGPGELRVLDGATMPFGFDPNTSVSLQAADSGRLAVLTGQGAVVLLSAGGAFRSEVDAVPGPAAPARQAPGGPWPGIVALRRDRIAFVDVDRDLDVYSTQTGQRVHRFPLPAGAVASQVGLYYGYAAYRVGRSVHLIKLVSGRDVVVARARHRLGPFQLGAAGLLYATSDANPVSPHSVVRLLPFARLRALNP